MMRKLALALIVTLAFSATATALEIAISTHAGWWPQATADREMQDIVDNVTAVPVLVFTPSDQDALADWVEAHTGDGISDMLILCGQFPATIYAPGNAQPDDSLAELFLDDGNCIINTGDYMFYVVDGAGTNAAGGLQNMMDIPGITMWDPIVDVTPTADGQLYTPSFEGFSPSRPWHLDELTNDWEVELLLGVNDDGTRADPAIIRNTVTGGRLGTFFQVADTDTDLRGEVISEWINNWYLLNVDDPALARGPSPADEAIDVPRDVTLGWTPGQTAVTHDVYLGTSFDDVNESTTPTSAGQSAASYQPADILDFETTYYWRVDEVNGTPDRTVFKGKVWSFTTEPFAYPIADVTATTNATSDAGAGPENTINGSGLNELDQHSTSSTDMWLATPGADPVYIQYEFDGVYKLHEMLVWNYNVQFELILGFGLKDVTVEYSVDGVEWTVLGDVELAQATARADYTANTTIAFDGVAAQYVRLTVISGQGMMGQYGLSEVRFMYIPAQAREPEPADGATNVAVDSALAWRAGRDATAHEVYFGTDAEALALADTVSGNSYTPAALDLATTYYWQITAVQDTESWAGNVWNFDTQNYLVVDDFESYDDEDNRIYDSWLDGWVNETGSTVGYLEEPFAEQTIVNSGRQSMPLFYDNAGVATSEADFELAQNWTANGIVSLSLFFHGATGNDGQLYVKINNTRIDYDGDAADIARASWQPWNIDLAATGASLTNVTQLTIGVEGAGAQGIVYIDDIRLYPLAPQFMVPTEPDAANLVAHYALDGNANDSSGNGHDGTPVGNITFVNDPVRGQVVSLPGGDDQYISIEGMGISGNMPRTIACWAKADSTSIPDWTLIFGFTGTDAGEGGNGSHFNIGSLGGPGGVGAHCWGWEETIFSDEQALEWHHYAMTYDGTTIRYYGDGMPMDT
ncbi:MAG: discoidin domain-containing protein, partial [Phycisphaerales bacterium]